MNKMLIALTTALALSANACAAEEVAAGAAGTGGLE